MVGPVFSEGERVTLHPIEKEDLSFVRDMVNNPQVRQGIASFAPKSMADERRWYEQLSESEGAAFLVCDSDTRVGVVSLENINTTFGSAEIGYYVAPESWGNGYATDAVRQAVDYAFTERRIHKIYAKTFAHNEASQQVLETVGFQREGVLREEAFIDEEYVDIHRYGLLNDEFSY